MNFFAFLYLIITVLIAVSLNRDLPIYFEVFFNQRKDLATKYSELILSQGRWKAVKAYKNEMNQGWFLSNHAMMYLLKNHALKT